MLRNGIDTVMLQLRQWYGERRHNPVVIEPTQGFSPPLPRSPRRTSALMSGGVDALTTLYCNRRDFPLEHPGAIRDCFFFDGFDIGGNEALDREIDNNSRLRLLRYHAWPSERT